MTESWMGVKEASTAQTSETFDRVQARQSEHYGGETRATKGACLDVMSRYLGMPGRSSSLGSQERRKKVGYLRQILLQLTHIRQAFIRHDAMHACCTPRSRGQL